MKHTFPLAVVIALVTSGAALADDGCRSPMADWQPREAATTYIAELGISADRLRIDDGCYEVSGRDSDGNRVELKLYPASLAVIELDVEFRPGADVSRYLKGARGSSSMTPDAPADTPLTPSAAALQVNGN